ncbi:MAG TPA: nitrogen fixation protein FixH, partial [Sulfitobacter pontiacus]|nr:nitrogen fixation protein FixH [Sulfitobacter pontiacus]
MSVVQTERPLTGWHVLAMFIGGFSIIISVNLALAFNAVRTFPGKETESSYVASQNFDTDRA